jgi:hypothetical protein
VSARSITRASVESIISGTLTSRVSRSRNASTSRISSRSGVLQADVEHLAGAAHLRAPHLGGGLELAGGDELLELPAAQHVGALADQ